MAVTGESFTELARRVLLVRDFLKEDCKLLKKLVGFIPIQSEMEWYANSIKLVCQSRKTVDEYGFTASDLARCLKRAEDWAVASKLTCSISMMVCQPPIWQPAS